MNRHRSGPNALRLRPPHTGQRDAVRLPGLQVPRPGMGSGGPAVPQRETIHKPTRPGWSHRAARPARIFPQWCERGLSTASRTSGPSTAAARRRGCLRPSPGQPGKPSAFRHAHGAHVLRRLQALRMATRRIRRGGLGISRQAQLQRDVDNDVLKRDHVIMTNNAEATASIDDWRDATPIPSDARDTERREREARERLADGARTGRLLKVPNEQWGAAEPANLIGRVLLATTHGKGSHPAEVDPADICAALALVAPARRDMDRLETQIIMIARNQNLPWRVIAEALGLQSPQAAAQRWQRLTGTTAPSSSVVM